MMPDKRIAAEELQVWTLKVKNDRSATHTCEDARVEGLAAAQPHRNRG